MKHLRTLAGFLALLFAAAGDVQGQNSPPDIYEEEPFLDDDSATTQNVLPLNLPQSHTIHSDDDVDWGICVQLASGETRLFSLTITDPVIPAGSRLIVEVFTGGL